MSKLVDLLSGNKNFVPFSRQTQGSSGRNVFIDVELIPRYIELTQNKASSAMRLAQAIVNLRALAAGFNSQSCLSKPFNHRTSVDGVEISYAIYKGGHALTEGVYVTDLRPRANLGNAGVAGLHKLKLQSGMWGATLTTEIPTTNVFGVINSGGVTVNGEAILLDAVRQSGRFVTANAKSNNSSAVAAPKECNLFFAPGSKIDADGLWLTSRQKRLPATDLARQLANAIKASEARTNVFTWYVINDGARVLLQALKLLPSIGINRLNQLVFSFSNPSESHAALKLALLNVGITLTPDMIQIDRSDAAAAVRQRFSMQNGIIFNNDRNALGYSALISKRAVNPNEFKGIASFEDEVAKQLRGAAQRWS